MAKNDINWIDKNSVGYKGEQAVIGMLNDSGIGFKDMRYNTDFQRIDIDFMLDGGITLEVKTDTTYPYYGNILLEQTCYKPTGAKPGWYYKTQTRYIVAYGGEGWKNPYIIYDFRKLKDLVERKEIGYYKKWYSEEEKEYQDGWCIPITDLKKYNDIYLMDGQTTEIIDCSMLYSKLKGLNNLKGCENKMNKNSKLNNEVKLDEDFIF